MHTEDFYIDKIKHIGRPEEIRSPKEDACYDLLDRLGVVYDRVDHDPAMTIALCHEAEKILGARICKNLFLCNRQKTQFYLLLLEGDKVFKTKYLSAQLGCARLSFADGADLEQFLGVQPGSATVLALPYDTAGQVQLVIDKPLLKQVRFACHPCLNTSTVAFSTEDLLNKLLPALDHAPIYVELPEEEDG